MNIINVIALDKEMRSWDTYTCLEATVKNMVTSLRAVGELQNPAIRERHWKQLMSSTKVRYIYIVGSYFPNRANQYKNMFTDFS